MQKIINDPSDFEREVLEGILLAHPLALRLTDDPGAVVLAGAPHAGKVGIVTGGGSGHLPLFMGYVGRGLADGAAVGNVFASPSAERILSVTRAVDAGNGVLYLYGNYGGDVMNFGLAAELASAEGSRVITVLAADDVASAPRGEEARRRGIAGIFFLYKVAGASAAAGYALDDVVTVTQRAAAGLRTMGVALAPCTVPAAGRPTFEIPVGQMEIGMGIHGERGIGRGELQSADRIVDELADRLLGDLPFVSGDRVAILVNGLGATPKEELYLLYRRLHAVLLSNGIEPGPVWVGEYATSLEMAGASISLLRLDEELEVLLAAPAQSPFFCQS